MFITKPSVAQCFQLFNSSSLNTLPVFPTVFLYGAAEPDTLFMEQRNEKQIQGHHNLPIHLLIFICLYS